MNRKIIGVTVGTTLRPDRIEDRIKPVKTVNGVKPDENGNVQIEVGANGGSGGVSIKDDGNGNVTITSTGVVSITDDGNGNVTIA